MDTIEKNEVFMSKWGFHPCSYSTYQKLRKLNSLYERALRLRADWDRWDRKQPQNRVIRKWKRDELGRKIGCEIVGPRLEPKLCPIFNNAGYGINHAEIHADYVNAKKPMATREEVKPMVNSVEEIDALYDKAVSLGLL